MAQPTLNWLDRHSEDEYIPTCGLYNIGVTPYRSLASGMLTGKYKRGQEAPLGSRKEESGWVDDPSDEVWDRIEEFEREASAADLSPTQYAVKWIADRPSITSVLVGCKRTDQLQPFVELFS